MQSQTSMYIDEAGSLGGEGFWVFIQAGVEALRPRNICSRVSIPHHVSDGYATNSQCELFLGYGSNVPSRYWRDKAFSWMIPAKSVLAAIIGYSQR
jgi:hypothetical protein